MPRDLNRTQAKLQALGMGNILQELLAGPLEAKIELPFSSLATAKAVQTALYNWLWFFPAIKARISISLNTTSAILMILPRTSMEKRGRRKAL